MSSTNLSQGVPVLPGAMVDQSGRPEPAWYAFFVNLWERTGGATASLTGLLDSISNAPGATLFRSATAWIGLNPGSRYQVLRAGQPYPEWDWLDGNSFQAQPANTFLAAPDGNAGVATFRAIGSDDLTGAAGEYPATATNDSAKAGYVGEYVSAQGSAAAALTSGAASNVTTINLSPGDWDVWGNIAAVPASATTQSQMRGWISTTSATDPTAPNSGAYALSAAQIAAGQSQVLPVGMMRLSLRTAATVYLSTAMTFAAGTMNASGFLGARRRR